MLPGLSAPLTQPISSVAQSTLLTAFSPGPDLSSDIVNSLINRLSLTILDIQGNKSTVLSRTSLMPVLGMLLASMESNEDKEHFLGLPPHSLTPGLEAAIHQKLGDFSKCHPYGKSINQQISTVNFIASAYFNQNEPLEQILSEHYQTRKLDNNGGKITDIVDDFVNDKTGGRINTLFSDLSELERRNMTIVIGNVMEFQGIWGKSFSPEKTVPGSFLCADGRKIENAKKMCLIDYFQLTFKDEFGAIAKNFQTVDGEQLVFIAITPCHSDANAIEKLDNETVNHLIDRLACSNKIRVKLMLPKIEIDNTDTRLLRKIEKALDSKITAQQLSRLGTEPNDELDMIQRVRASIDEKGARAVMTTAARVVSKGMAPEPTCFDFDCPGYIAVIDEHGNRLLESVIKDDEFLDTFGPQ